MEAERERELLDRHRPVLRFDPQYDYRVLAAESAVAVPGNILRTADGEVIARAGGSPALGLETLTSYPDGREPRSDDFLAMAPDHLGASRRMEWEEATRGRIYGRAVVDGERTWLQYWFWLYYNPKHLLGFGRHEGDWEMVQVGLAPDGEPEVATYAQHASGESRTWRSGVETAPDDPRRPVVYVAPLSHASYFEPNAHPYLLGIDHPYADGPVAELPLATFGPWVRWPGRWGKVERKLAFWVDSGPRSPEEQGSKWGEPGVWHRKMQSRHWRVRFGRLARGLGAHTHARAPRIADTGRDAGTVRVRWELRGRGLRSARHLHLTVHEGHFVIASRLVAKPGRSGEATLAVPQSRRPTAVIASAYNVLRQRSDVVEEPLPGG